MTYTLCDEEGFGLVMGQIVRLKSTIPGEMVVAYVPFNNWRLHDPRYKEFETVPYNALKFARAILDRDGKPVTTFEDITLSPAECNALTCVDDYVFWLKRSD